MRDEDMEELTGCVDGWKPQIGNVTEAIVCSPDAREIKLLKEVWPPSHVHGLERADWNLDMPCDRDADLVLASHVFMCAKDPAAWIRNICQRTRYLIILDLCIGHRGGPEGERSPSTGDVMRYSYPPLMQAIFPDAFDLNTVKDRIVGFKSFEYPSACGVPGFEKAKQFIVLLRGDR